MEKKKLAIFRAKPDTWFLAGSLVEVIDDYRDDPTCAVDMGAFLGVRVCENPNAEARKLGEAYMDEEVCGFDEFEVVQLRG